MVTRLLFLILIWENVGSGSTQEITGTISGSSDTSELSTESTAESTTEDSVTNSSTVPSSVPSSVSSSSVSSSMSTSTSHIPQTTTASCGSPNVGNGSSNTTHPQVILGWSVSGCSSSTALAYIQIWKDDILNLKCSNMTLEQSSNCSSIQASIDVDYEANDQSCKKLEPFQYFNASVVQFRSRPDCRFAQLEGTDVTFRTPPRALTKLADADLNLPPSQTYCQHVSNGQILLRLNSTYFSNPGAPKILGYHIVIGSAAQFSPDWFTSATTYQDSQADHFQKSFYVTDRTRPLNPFDESGQTTGCCLLKEDNQVSCGDSGYTKSVDILIGDVDCSKKDIHCVGLLPPGKSFWIGLLAIPDISICDSSIYCKELQTQVYLFSNITSCEKPRPKPATGPDIGAIIGGLLGALFLIAIVIIGVILYLKYYRKPHIQVTPSSINMVQTQMGRSRPIDLYRFGELLPDLMRDSGFLLLKEFSYLCDHSPSIRGQKHVAGLNDENMARNRYVDILPFDDTRVRLAGDRYINASYIRGFNQSKEYIAAQGPMGENDRKTRGKYSTIDDFFEMIWQHDVSCIVMLTQLMEAGRPKCAQYWPADVGGIEQHGIFTVILHIETDRDTFVERQLELKKSGQSRSILQYHYKRWPDMTVTDEQELLDFIRLVRQSVQTVHLKSPLLVHCSAGVGRTGVFISVDILLQHIRHRSYVDIAGCVYALRQQRVRMVQSEDQYIMLYSALGIAIHQRLQERQSLVINGDSIHSATV